MSIDYSITYGVPRSIIYKAFLDEFELSKTTRTKAHMKPIIGGEFQLYDGKISGKNLELVDCGLLLEEGRSDQAGVEDE